MPTPLEERIKHESFRQPSNHNSLVWRYMALPKLAKILSSNSLYLARLDSFEDSHEGSFPKTMIEQRDNLYESEGVLQRLPQHIETNKLSLTCCYVNCWALCDSESEALWRLYTENNEGVAIQSTYSKLINLIRSDDELFIGCVNYLNYDSDRFDNPWWPAGGNLFQPVMHKRLPFAHEHEVRLVKYLHNHWMPEVKRPKGLHIPINFTELIDGIFINPYASNAYAQEVKDLVIKSFPQLESKIFWSKMKTSPQF